MKSEMENGKRRGISILWQKEQSDCAQNAVEINVRHKGNLDKTNPDTVKIRDACRPKVYGQMCWSPWQPHQMAC